MKPVILTRSNFESEIKNTDKPVLIDFYADWCGPCRMLSPVIEQLAEELEDVKVCKLNIDEQDEIASALGIMTIPTVMVVKDGKLVKKAVGYQSKEKLKKLLAV